MNWKSDTRLTLSIISARPARSHNTATTALLHPFNPALSRSCSPEEVIPRLFLNPRGWGTKVNPSILVDWREVRRERKKERPGRQETLCKHDYIRHATINAGSLEAIKLNESTNIWMGRTPEIKVAPTEGQLWLFRTSYYVPPQVFSLVC